MRGSLASGLLKRIGLSELVANSDDEYIELAIKLIEDKQYHNKVVEKIAETKDVLYQDKSVITFLEEFLIKKLSDH